MRKLSCACIVHEYTGGPPAVDFGSNDDMNDALRIVALYSGFAKDDVVDALGLVPSSDAPFQLDQIHEMATIPTTVVGKMRPPIITLSPKKMTAIHPWP